MVTTERKVFDTAPLSSRTIGGCVTKTIGLASVADFAAVAEIRARIVQARNRGAAVLLVSEDLDELLELADRVAVIHRGKIMGTFASHEADQERLGLLMAGQAA